MTDKEFKDRLEAQLTSYGLATYMDEDGRVIIITAEMCERLLEMARSKPQQRVKILVQTPEDRANSIQTPSSTEWLS